MASPSDLPLLNSDDDSSFENIDNLAEKDFEEKSNPIVEAALKRMFPEEYAMFEATRAAGLMMRSLDEVTAEALANMLKEEKAKAGPSTEKAEDADGQTSGEPVKHKENTQKDQKLLEKIALREFAEYNERYFKLLTIFAVIVMLLNGYTFSQSESETNKLLAAIRIPTSKPLDFTFPVGRRMSIVGVPAANASRFHVDFIAASGDIAFHLSARFEEKVAVLNHAVNGQWNFDLEERYSEFPFQQRKMLDLDFYNDDDRLQIRVNNKYFVHFAKRTPSFTDAVQLSIGGDISVYAIKDKPAPPEPIND